MNATGRRPRSVTREPMATADELAAYLRVPVGTLYQWNHRRKGPEPRRVGKHLRYEWSEVDAWVKSSGWEVTR